MMKMNMHAESLGQIGFICKKLCVSNDLLRWKFKSLRNPEQDDCAQKKTVSGNDVIPIELRNLIKRTFAITGVEKGKLLPAVGCYRLHALNLTVLIRNCMNITLYHLPLL